MNQRKELEKLRLVLLDKCDPNYNHHLKSLFNWERILKYAKKVSEYIPKNGKIIDIGCGAGAATAAIKVLRPDCKVTGVDMKKNETWETLKKKFSINFIELNAENLKRFDNDQFDVVVSFGVLEHVENKEEFLKETFRILKKNGYYMIFDLPNRYGLSEFIADLIIKTHHHDKKYTTREIRRIISKYTKGSIEIKRENILPAQFHRLNEKLGEMMNKHYSILSGLDDVLRKIPVNIFAQSITVVCKKL